MLSDLQQLRIRTGDSKAEIFTDRQLKDFIDMAAQEQGDPVKIVSLAFILLMTTQALKECSKEFTICDNGIEFQPAPVTHTMLELIRLELERLKLS